VGSFVNAETAGISSTAGLIVFNNEMAQVEGLWQALRQEGGNIVWFPVATYQAVPYQHMAAGNALAALASINVAFVAAILRIECLPGHYKRSWGTGEQSPVVFVPSQQHDRDGYL
jgi:hypothetical protein